eukprot:scaffold3608_cov114-Skeletonema_dohrnii-CCMP3373.AAC.7
MNIGGGSARISHSLLNTSISILVAAMRYSAACCASRQGLDLDCLVRQQVEVFTASITDV